MKRLLDVWRDLYGAFELIGFLYAYNSDIVFRYDRDYDGAAISVALPLQSEPFSPKQTRVFFAALNPEGRTRASIARLARFESDEYEPLLELLNNETIGALAFCSPSSEPGLEASYRPIEQELFDVLAESPTESAVRAMTEARLSLSGAMAKIGLYRNESSGE